MILSCRYSGRVGHFPRDLEFLKHPSLKETGEVVSKTLQGVDTERALERRTPRKALLLTHTPLSAFGRLAPSLCNYHSHNEKLSLACQYLQGTSAADAEWGLQLIMKSRNLSSSLREGKKVPALTAEPWRIPGK